MILEKLTPQLLNEVIDIYLQYAYDTQEKRDRNRVAFEEGLSPEAMLEQFLEETDPRQDAHHSYVLRLGSEEYPHMKLALWEAYYRGEYILAVDCHDGFRFDQNSPDYKEWLKLKNQNRQRKLQIEEFWYEAGFSTLRRLKESALSRTDCIREFRGLEILLVDDDPDGAAIIRMILNANGFKCRHERSVKDAAAYIADGENKCGLAIIDIVLCDGNGLEVLKAIRAEPRIQDIPVIMTSAMNGSDVQIQGIHNYLRKPFSAAELVEQVERIIRQQYDGHKVFLERKKQDPAETRNA